ncbi:hypothetical protein XELAEV_18017680mg [Xenopus laevis]|uniref:Reverse transcriptase domain-containing protein n=1 Tax=Xenopus laevis TaxID=8355 RepID=A0A974HSX9_XENLA|nr:hypothetical protein XELAEV_18017680mg [Xenopus laevis]
MTEKYTCHILPWHRYMDDILIWQSPPSLLPEFVETLNLNLILKFTYTCKRTKLHFLHVTLEVNSEGKTETYLYCKESASNNLLHTSSAHPHNFIERIPKIQYLRLWRICTSDAKFKLQAKQYLKIRATNPGPSIEPTRKS